MDVNFHLTHSAHNATAQAGDMLTRSIHIAFLSASLYFSKRGAYWDRLCRDVVGCHARALWQQWSLLNRFRTEQGHCGACRRKWRLTDTDLCPCGETQTMSHIVESCPVTKLNGGLSRLHSADEDAVSWLTNYGKWHAYEKKEDWP